ncbi:hypothetical protein KXV28_006257, partial [Aspergillus fumigatus]
MHSPQTLEVPTRRLPLPQTTGITLDDVAFSNVQRHVFDTNGKEYVEGAPHCHTRLGGATGTELTPSKCRSSTAGIDDSGCSAGSLMMHITSTGSAYLENVGLQTIRQRSQLGRRR